MNFYPDALARLIHELSKFPGIGYKSAERLAFYLLKAEQKDINNLSQSIIELKEKIRFCKICFNISEEDICSICTNPNRITSIICVVENFKDLISFEKTLEYKGLYHVLMGHLSPIDGIGPDKIKIKELINRISQNKIDTIDTIDTIEEVILATNPNTEGDATSLYIAELLKNYPIKISRIAKGLPIGSDLEFADPVTLISSLEKRESLN